MYVDSSENERGRTAIAVERLTWLLLNREVPVSTDYPQTYLLHGASPWEANWFAASQEIPRISQNLNVHYRTHKRPPPG